VVFIYYHEQAFSLTQFHKAIANTWSKYTRDQSVDWSHRAHCSPSTYNKVGNLSSPKKARLRPI